MSKGPAEPDLVAAAQRLADFGGEDLTRRIGQLEKDFSRQSRDLITELLSTHGVNRELLGQAYLFKQLAGQINVTIHALGILLCLPALLESNEKIEYLSLGAGNTGRPFDLETDQRVAEFKFIHWRGGAEVIRQNALFKDFYGLAEALTSKRRYLYVLGDEHPNAFFHSGRSLRSVMSRNRKLWSEFEEKYGDQFQTVQDYYSAKSAEVTIEDVSPLVPELVSAKPTTEQRARTQARRSRGHQFRVHGDTTTYTATRLLFRADVIESLGPSQRVRIETPDGNFEMTRADFYRVFANVAQSASYLERGVYHYSRTPDKALPFLRP